MSEHLLTDEHLLAQLRDRDRADAALTELMRRYHAPMMAALRHILRCATHEDREEVLMSTFLRIALRHGQFDRSKATVRSWVFTILRRVAIDRLRQLRREMKIQAASQHGNSGTDEPTRLEDTVEDDALGPAESYARAEEWVRLARWVMELPTRERQALLAMHPELHASAEGCNPNSAESGSGQMTFQRAARQLGVSVSSAHHHYKRAIRRLQERAGTSAPTLLGA